MTYYVTALTNDAARLIVSESCTTDPVLARLMADNLSERGFIVFKRQEG